jgi:hypothetical protein
MILLTGVIYEIHVNIDLDGMICIPRFMKIGSVIQVMIKLLPRQSERLQCW